MNETSTHSRKKTVETKQLSETMCRDLKAGEYQDKEEPALRFYVSDKGTRSFGIYKWSPVDGMAIRKSLGKWVPGVERLKAVRGEAKDIARAIEKGEFSKATKEAQKAERATTLQHVLDLYTRKLKREGKTKWNWAEEAMKHSYKDWMKLPLSKITRLMIANRQDEIAFGTDDIKKRGPAAAGVSLKALRAVYNFAKKQEHYAGENAAKLVDLPKEVVRERVLTAKERAAILKALDDSRWLPYVKPYFRLLMLTGARRTNLTMAEWSELDLEEGVWTIPAKKSKSKYEMVLYLRPEAVEFFKGQQGKHDRWVFPSPKGSAAGHLVDVWNIWKEVLGAAEVDESITVHDLRRTFGSDLVSDGVSINIVAEALGHRNAATTAKHYAKVRGSSVRDALNRVPG